MFVLIFKLLRYRCLLAEPDALLERAFYRCQSMIPDDAAILDDYCRCMG